METTLENFVFHYRPNLHFLTITQILSFIRNDKILSLFVMIQLNLSLNNFFPKDLKNKKENRTINKIQQIFPWEVHSADLMPV